MEADRHKAQSLRLISLHLMNKLSHCRYNVIIDNEALLILVGALDVLDLIRKIISDLTCSSVGSQEDSQGSSFDAFFLLDVSQGGESCRT